MEERMSREDLFAMTVAMHFPGVKPGDRASLCCRECEDYRHGVCAGENLRADEVLFCMMEHAFNSSWGVIH